MPGAPNRPLPGDFREVGPSLTIGATRKHYGCSYETAVRWFAETGLVPSAKIRTGRKPRPVPADFAARYAEMGQTKLARHYAIAEGTIRRWIDESGLPRRRKTVKKPKAKKARKAKRPMPADFCRLVASLGVNKATIHFQAGAATIHRWLAEAGIVLTYKPGPKPKAPAGLGSVKPAKRTKNATTPYALRLNTADASLAGRAADYLRRDYAPVYHRGRENKAETGIWQVGSRKMAEAEMIALAKGKGMDRPARPIPAPTIRSSILDAQAGGERLPPAGYDHFRPYLPPVRNMYDTRMG